MNKKPSKNNHPTFTELLWAELRLAMVILLVFALLGWLSGQLLWNLLAGLVLFLSWRFISMLSFLYWLNQPQLTPPDNKTSQLNSLPLFAGAIAPLANSIYKQRRKEKKQYKKLRRLLKKIRESLFLLQEGVVLLNKNHQLIWWNQSAEDLLGINMGSRGQLIFDVIESEEFRQYYQQMDRAEYNEDNEDQHQEGIRLASNHNSNHEPKRYLQYELTAFGKEKLLMVYDVTHLQRLEQMRKDFVANVSHELRTPLTVLMGYIDLFSEQEDIDPKWQRGFNLMTQQAKRMNNIVNDLLMLSQLENQEKFTTSCVDMPLMMSHLFDDAQIYNKEYQHFIELHIDSQKNIIGSEVYLNSAFLNLITNAIKYTPNGGEIHISWTENKHGCRFVVSDNGLGISPEHIDRLTERFYRVDSGRSRTTGGTGLGLAIVKHVLYQHGATLTIKSSEGKGSTFKVFFPNERLC